MTQAAVAPKRHTIRYVAGVVGLVVLAVVGILATRKPAEQRDASSPLLGQYAPDFQAEKIDGGQLKLSDLRGKPIVLNFFASWCVPCQKEHQAFKTFAAQNKSKANVVMVTFDDTKNAANAFFADKGRTWPVVDDSSGGVALDWGVRGPPETFIIDANGVVRQKYIGEITVNSLNTSLEAVLGGSK